MLPNGAASLQLWFRDIIANPSPGGRSFSLQPEGTRIQVGTPWKNILEEVVKLCISFLSFINGD